MGRHTTRWPPLPSGARVTEPRDLGSMADTLKATAVWPGSGQVVSSVLELAQMTRSAIASGPSASARGLRIIAQMLGCVLM